VFLLLAGRSMQNLAEITPPTSLRVEAEDVSDAPKCQHHRPQLPEISIFIM
jgi:hypothetical protein